MFSIAFDRDEKKAFDMIFIRFYPRVKRFVMGFCGDEYEAENVAQDVFMKLWMKRRHVSSVENLDAYIYAMARHAALDALKSVALRAHSAVEDSDIADETHVEDALYSHELREIIHRQIEKMPPQQRRVFRMSRMDGLKNDEIAETLHISKRTVEAHISAALVELRKFVTVFIVEMLLRQL
ncbi:RNA polymerase sigma-70 factor [Prevotella sp. oral taxon 820]|nr:RNA polymerase sigma-70 factor [Prevotella sp. oral taxon 820]